MNIAQVCLRLVTIKDRDAPIRYLDRISAPIQEFFAGSDVQELHTPQPKVRSHLTITVQSKLMSGPCVSTARGPKPPVAPKPKRPHSLTNGDLTLTNGDFSAKVETSEVEEVSQNDTREKEELVEENLSNDGDSVGSDETVKADDCEAEDVAVILTEDGTLADDDDEKSSTPLPYTTDTDEDDGDEENVRESTQYSGNELDHLEQSCEIGAGGLEFGFNLLPTVTEEYTYDVIGPADDASDTCESCETAETGDIEAWQPERATKDVSGCFRFTSSTEDVFGPYSVIESVPIDTSNTADPDWEQDSADDEPTHVPESSNQEPFYVSSDDVDKLEDKQILAENEEAEKNDKKDADEYADIDESFCPKDEDDFTHLEGVSSEDYVEIGDEETEEEPGTNPELTNRVVFAHTTEAFEEDIEELDCHIVPYYEDSDSDSEEHIYEEAGFDSEGENFVILDHKSIVTRSRSYSGKVPGYVPETVPEETGTEYQNHDYYTVNVEKGEESEQPKVIIPTTKSRRFLLSSRSADGPELTLSSASEFSKDEVKIKRKDDTLSLPCVITSSGSFSQKSYHSSSGVSTPTSLADIPPPFELAYITKRPVTKSSPALLIHHEPNDKNKKKKTSFKRFLTLKFKRKSDSKGFSDGSVRSSRSSSESSHHGPSRVIELDRRSTCSSPQLRSVVNSQQRSSDLPSAIVLYKDQQKRKGEVKLYGRGVSRVESFEERSRRSMMPLPLTKPRSISFPSADTSDYENIPAMSAEYENVQIPGRPIRSHTVTEFFENPNRTTVQCNDNDGYVDMNSFPGIENKMTAKADSESAYTEPFPMSSTTVGLSADEDHGRTSEEEDGVTEPSFDRQIDGRSRAFYIAKELVDSERLHVSALKHLQEDFRAAVSGAVVEEGEPVLDDQRLGEILGVLPQVYNLHKSLLSELEHRIDQWEDSPRMVDVILSRGEDFRVFDTYISEYDRSMFLLEESRRNSPAFNDIKRAAEEAEVPLKHQLLQVIVRVLQYRMLLTLRKYSLLFADYLNNLSPDSKEYEDTQAALVTVSEVADQANDNLKQGRAWKEEPGASVTQTNDEENKTERLKVVHLK
ncbi:hypothetical protein WMY93_012530 [Mugilogobius chulae]|uniref:DH domain-containing protein n=1 Tax=Mugilogobius chulae TaxID=88201 RepID=A0AAW0PFY0_9GOBI